MIIGPNIMLIENYKNLGRERINEILLQGWKQIEFIEINARLSEVYENITESKEPLPDADKYKDISGKKQYL